MFSNKAAAVLLAHETFTRVKNLSTGRNVRNGNKKREYNVAAIITGQKTENKRKMGVHYS